MATYIHATGTQSDGPHPSFFTTVWWSRLYTDYREEFPQWPVDIYIANDPVPQIWYRRLIFGNDGPQPLVFDMYEQQQSCYMRIAITVCRVRNTMVQ